MNQVVVSSLIFMVVRCESELGADDHSILHGIAEKIGSYPTILKVFIKGDVQEEDIEKLFNISPRDGKLQNGPLDLKRNRRNSIADYIGKLYSFNRLLRPYRFIFRGINNDETTHIPWLQKILGGVRSEPATESFWGMALGAHTFSPIARPLAHTRMPYYRIRNQQRIDKLLGITRNYQSTFAENSQANPLLWIKNQKKFDRYVLQARSHEETTTPKIDHNEVSATTRKAFHRAPFDVAGLRKMNFTHLHAITTPRRMRFCEKQCMDEEKEAKSRRPGTAGGPHGTESQYQTITRVSDIVGARPVGKLCPSPNNITNRGCDNGWIVIMDVQMIAPAIQAEYGTTEECTCTEVCTGCRDCLRDEEEPKRNYLSMVIKGVTRATTKKTVKVKSTTWKFRRPKVERQTGPIWTLPPNSVLDQTQTEEQRGHQDKTRATSESITEWSDSSLAQRTNTAYEPALATISPPGHESRCTCKKPQPTKLCMLQCPHLLIPTRMQNLLCPTTMQSTTCSSAKSTTCSHAECTACCHTESACCCQGKPPSRDIPVSSVETLEQSKAGCTSDRKTCNKGNPQKIVVRISSELGEVPVVIMRDNGVSGVSLSLVNDYLLDENNRLMKCLGHKPVGRYTGTNDSRRLQPKVKGKQQSIRHQLPSLQPKRYSFRLRCKPARKLLRGNSDHNPYPEENQISGIPIPDPLTYKINSPDSPMMSGFGVPIGFQYPRQFGSFKMSPHSFERLNRPMGSMDEFSRNGIGPTDYPRFKFDQDDPSGLSNPQFEPQGLNLQPFPQSSDTSQLLGYRPPLFPVFYPSKNYIPPPKYVIPGLQ